MLIKMALLKSSIFRIEALNHHLYHDYYRQYHRIVKQSETLAMDNYPRHITLSCTLLINGDGFNIGPLCLLIPSWSQMLNLALKINIFNVLFAKQLHHIFIMIKTSISTH